MHKDIGIGRGATEVLNEIGIFLLKIATWCDRGIFNVFGQAKSNIMEAALTEEEARHGWRHAGLAVGDARDGKANSQSERRKLFHAAQVNEA